MALVLASLLHGAVLTNAVGLVSVAIGSYCNDNDGLCMSHVYSVGFNMSDGAIQYGAALTSGYNSTFVTSHADGAVFFAPNEAGYGRTLPGQVRAFRLTNSDRSAARKHIQDIWELHESQQNVKAQQLSQIGDPGATGGDMPAHMSVDGSGKYVLLANYGSGSVSSIEVTSNGAPASIPASRVQVGGHPHSIYSTPDNKCVLSPNIALDRIYTFRFDSETGQLTQTGFAQESLHAGPRHLAFSPSDPKHVFVLNEPSTTITQWYLMPDCTLGQVGSLSTNYSTLRPGDNDSEWHSAEIKVHDGWLWASNRYKCTPTAKDCNGTIATFAIEKDGLRLVAHTLSGGHSPRTFDVDPTGNWMVIGNGGIQPTYDQLDSLQKNLRVLRINQKTGIPSSTAAAVWPMAWNTTGSPGGIAFLT